MGNGLNFTERDADGPDPGEGQEVVKFHGPDPPFFLGMKS